MFQKYKHLNPYTNKAYYKDIRAAEKPRQFVAHSGRRGHDWQWPTEALNRDTGFEVASWRKGFSIFGMKDPGRTIYLDRGHAQWAIPSEQEVQEAGLRKLQPELDKYLEAFGASKQDFVDFAEDLHSKSLTTKHRFEMEKYVPTPDSELTKEQVATRDALESKIETVLLQGIEETPWNERNGYYTPIVGRSNNNDSPIQQFPREGADAWAIGSIGLIPLALWFLFEILEEFEHEPNRVYPTGALPRSYMVNKDIFRGYGPLFGPDYNRIRAITTKAREGYMWHRIEDHTCMIPEVIDNLNP